MGFEWIQGLFVLGVALFVIGFIMNVACRPGAFSNIGADVASALGLIVVYAIVIVAVDNAPGFLESLCEGIPFFGAISDFGSLRDTFFNAPHTFVAECFELIVLSMVVDIVKVIFGAGHLFAKKRFSMTLFFTYFTSSMIGLALFNAFVKTSSLYASIVSVLGAFSATVAVSLMVLVLIFRKPSGLLGTISSFFTVAVFKTLVYIAIILCLETFFGGVGTGVSVILDVLIGFGPLLVLILGMVILFKSVKF